MPTPFLGSVILATHNVAYPLASLSGQTPVGLLQALTGAQIPGGRAISSQYVSIQSDPSNGSGILRIGNAAMATNFCGVVVYAGQSWPVFSMDANLIQMSDIYLMGDTAGMQVNIGFITR